MKDETIESSKNHECFECVLFAIILFLYYLIVLTKVICNKILFENMTIVKYWHMYCKRLWASADKYNCTRYLYWLRHNFLPTIHKESTSWINKKTFSIKDQIRLYQWLFLSKKFFLFRPQSYSAKKPLPWSWRANSQKVFKLFFSIKIVSGYFSNNENGLLDFD